MNPTLEQQVTAEQFSYCGPSDAVAILTLINRCIQIRQESDLEGIFESLRGLLEFDCLSFLLAEFNEEGMLLDLESFQVNWPLKQPHPGQNPGLEHNDPIFSLLMPLAFEHHYWNLKAFDYQGNPEWRQQAIEAGLGEGYAVRAQTHNKKEYSQINLCGVTFERRTEFILDTVKPHIHKAFTLVRQKREQTLLEDREKMILQMLQRGMNRRMIADELAISESRTQQLMNKIYTKLDAHNAPHAVAISLSKGLIDFA
ncbi:MAG: helix-turn-helix transcriptional regulator [bacterium]|nr:helix-turn-helix transcriptional regulator [bacterium]